MPVRPYSDMERRALDAVQAGLRRGRLPPGSYERALAALRAFRSVRRVQVNRDRNAGADLGGEAGDYLVERFDP